MLYSSHYSFIAARNMFPRMENMPKLPPMSVYNVKNIAPPPKLLDEVVPGNYIIKTTRSEEVKLNSQNPNVLVLLLLR